MHKIYGEMLKTVRLPKVPERYLKKGEHCLILNYAIFSGTEVYEISTLDGIVILVDDSYVEEITDFKRLESLRLLYS